MTGGVRDQQVRPSAVQFIAQTATHQWIYVYHSLQHARPRRREKEKKTEQNLFVHSGKSEAELALDRDCAYLNERSVIFNEEMIGGEKGWQQMRSGY